ncbi:MAG: glycosyltransferase [Candidatus Omnitrophica bacterium]|nr:glycosyltransferase [Candidatus Omnitrophota bacterium]
MTRTPLVTVCVPTYNRAGYLRQCLDSILAQTVDAFELLVLDNASTDDTPEVVRHLADPRVRCVRHPENLGQIPNVNRGLELARGEFVCVCHDDDVWAPRFLERQLEVMRRHPSVALSHTAVWLCTEEGVARGVHRVSARDYLLNGREAFLRYLAFGHDVVFSTTMVRRACYQQAGPFDARYLCADFDMWLRLSLQGDVAYVAKPLAGYRVHGASASSGMTAVRWFQEYFEIFDRAVALGAPQLPELPALAGRLRARAKRFQARRARIEAAACLAAGHDAAAQEYLDAAARLDRSLPSSLATGALRLCRNAAGRSVLSGIKAVRRRVRSATSDKRQATVTQ